MNYADKLKAMPDVFSRLEYIVEYGRGRPPLPERDITEENRISGCTSQLWVAPSFRGGYCFFRSDSDAAVVRGVAAMICDGFSAKTPDEIVETEVDFLKEAGITQHLSPNRRNGLSQIVQTIKDFAIRQL